MIRSNSISLVVSVVFYFLLSSCATESSKTLAVQKVDTASQPFAGTLTGKVGRAHPRNLEEIQLAFDKNKGAIYLMYQNALRTDTGLKGKVALEFTIAPSGVVTACKVASSELDAPELLEKLVDRVKAINFGAKDVEEMTITYPIIFFPTS